MATAILLGSWLVFAWTYGLLHLCFAVARLLLTRPGGSLTGRVRRRWPSIAVFYVTKDDFQSTAAESCLRQRYPRFRVYVLDDSVSLSVQKEIDAFVKQAGENVELIRRTDCTGAKAGNVNHALGLLPKEFEAVAIVDSDSLLPPHFLQESVQDLLADENVAFVQALQSGYFSSEGHGLKVIASEVDVTWQLYLPVRSKFGMTMCYGHGVLVDRKALEEVGGMPRVLSEDIAFSLLCRQTGKVGRLGVTMTCGEEFPRTVRAFRKRLFRWVQADIECAAKLFPAFLASAGPLLSEKVDASLRQLKQLALPVTLPLLLLLAVCALGNELGGDTSLPAATLMSSVSTAFGAVSSRGVMLVTLLLSVMPLVARLAVASVDRYHSVRAGITSGFMEVASSIVALYSLVVLLVRRRPEFLVTGAVSDTGRVSHGLVGRDIIGPNGGLVLVLESLVCAFLVWCWLLTGVWAMLLVAIVIGTGTVFRSSRFGLSVFHFLSVSVFAILMVEAGGALFGFHSNFAAIWVLSLLPVLLAR